VSGVGVENQEVIKLVLFRMGKGAENKNGQASAGMGIDGVPGVKKIGTKGKKCTYTNWRILPGEKEGKLGTQNSKKGSTAK